MFEDFKSFDEKHEFEVVANGFVLRVTGRDKDDGWLCRSYIFEDNAELFAAIGVITKRVR